MILIFMKKDYIKTVWVLVINQNKEVLLVCHKKWAWHIEWIYWLPAWRVEENESLEDSAVRELKEETWLYCEKQDLKMFEEVFYADIKRSDWTIKSFSLNVFSCDKYTWDLKSDNETTPYFISSDKIWYLELLPNIEEIVSLWLEKYF